MYIYIVYIGLARSVRDGPLLNPTCYLNRKTTSLVT